MTSEAAFMRSDASLSPLPLFEMPRWLAEPLVRAFRTVNTMVDMAFYDVPDLVRDLAARDLTVSTMQGQDKLPSRIVDLSALTNPEGALLLIDAATPPYVHRFLSVKKYLDSSHPETREVEVVTVTGVGSSAYGSAAFGWQISRWIGRPVLAIVPGYGLADMTQQALGGWFAFGLHDFLRTKSVVQDFLAVAAPQAAEIGRSLPQTIPGHEAAPVFEHGSGSSDVLHALLCDARIPLKTLIGHSKGALVIKNAIRSVTDFEARDATIVTLGCPIDEELKGVRYRQYLGLFDLLGQLNGWGNLPDDWPPSTHTTNPYLPLALPVDVLLSEQARA
jgi:hypothetical protein